MFDFAQQRQLSLILHHNMHKQTTKLMQKLVKTTF
jgi:hypothetical protein